MWHYMLYNNLCGSMTFAWTFLSSQVVKTLSSIWDIWLIAQNPNWKCTSWRKCGGSQMTFNYNTKTMHDVLLSELGIPDGHTKYVSMHVNVKNKLLFCWLQYYKGLILNIKWPTFLICTPQKVYFCINDRTFKLNTVHLARNYANTRKTFTLEIAIHVQYRYPIGSPIWDQKVYFWKHPVRDDMYRYVHLLVQQC